MKFSSSIQTYLNIRIEHLPDPLALRDFGWRDNFHHSLKRTCTQRKPLAEDELESVTSILRSKISRLDFEIKGANNLGDFVRVSMIVRH